MCSASVLLCEFLGLGAEACVVLAELLGDLGLKRVISVDVLQEGEETLEHEFGVESGYPVVLDGLSADLACLLLDVGVVDLGLEENLFPVSDDPCLPWEP